VGAAETTQDHRHESLVEQLRSLAAEAARQSAVELVELHVAGSSRSRRVRVDIDRAGPRSVTLADCQAVSLALGQAIDEAGILPTEYVLDVSSPGLDRPIRSADDARRNVGRRIVVTTSLPVDGHREFHGLLCDFCGDALRVDDDQAGEVRIPLDCIVIARQEVAF